MVVHSDVYFPFDGRARTASDLASVRIERTAREGPEVVERYTLDGKGIVDVAIRDVDSGYEKTYRIGRTHPAS